MGKGKGKSGGGGASGKVGYSEYLESRHKMWLEDIDGYMRSSIAANPYENAESYDPSMEVALMQEASLSFGDYVNTLSPASLFQAYFSTAQGMVDNWASTDTITGLQTAYEANQALTRARAVAQFSAGMADINAVMGTAFVVGTAIIDAQLAKDSDAFLEGLYMNKEKDKASLIGQGIQGMFGLEAGKLNARKDAGSMAIEAARMQIVAYNDQYKEDIEYDARDVMWEIDVVQEAMSTLGAPAGAIPGGGDKGLSSKNSPMQGALSGALSGAAYGAMLGGGPGAAAGAVIGGASALGIPTIGGELLGM